MTLPLKDIWRCLEIFVVVRTGVGAADMWWVEAGVLYILSVQKTR